MTSHPPAGIVVIDKPAGWTSHDVVARCRGTLGTKKVGHAGTLDPMATGVLVLAYGRATRLLGYLMHGHKAYEATIRLGAATTSDDAEGEVVLRAATDDVTDQSVRAELARQVGEIDQVPAAVSAIKVDGQRAYARVRAGETVELAPRRVTISAIDVGGLSRLDGFLDVEVAVRCSSGTYVRAIARDLGTALGVGGHLTRLRRTAVGPFTVDEANADLENLSVVAIEDAARRAFPVVELDQVDATDVSFGRPLTGLVLAAPGPHALFAPDGSFLALYESRGQTARPVAVFV